MGVELSKIINHTHVRFSSKLFAPAYRKQSNSLGMRGTCIHRCQTVLPCWWASHPPACGISKHSLSKWERERDRETVKIADMINGCPENVQKIQGKSSRNRGKWSRNLTWEKSLLAWRYLLSALMGCPLKCQVIFGCGSPSLHIIWWRFVPLAQSERSPFPWT